MKQNITVVVTTLLILTGCGYAELASYSGKVVGTPLSILVGESKAQHSVRVVVRYPTVADLEREQGFLERVGYRLELQ